MDVRSFTVGPVAENSYLFRREGSDRGLIVDPGDEPEKLLAAIDELGVGARRDPAHPHPLRPRRRRRAGREGDRRARLLPRDRDPGARRHHVLRPLGRVRPVRELERRGDGRRRRDARARRLSRSTSSSRPATAPATSPTWSPRRAPTGRSRRTCSAATSSSRARSAAPTCPAATGTTLEASIKGLLDAYPDDSRVYPGHMGLTTLGAERAGNPFLGGHLRLRAEDGSALSGSEGNVRHPARAGAGARAHPRPRRASCSARAGYGRLETPHFEETELFARGVGESTDIVTKEMFTFEDQGGRSLTLRPEGTAPVARAYIEHGMHKLPQPVKALVRGPVLPPRAAAEGPLPAVQPDRRRGDRHRRARSPTPS